MFAALHLSDFHVSAALRNQPESQTIPHAILDLGTTQAPREKLPLLATNQAARATGIGTGWPLNRAMIRCPDLRLISRNPAAEIVLRDELVFLGESLSADVEITAMDVILLDLTGSQRPSTAAINSLSLAGMEIHHACAATPDLAHLAARHKATRGRIVAPADLVPLPLSVLGSLALSHPSLSLLELWGLRTLGDFMKLPRQDLVERLGPQVGKWHDLLHGKSCRLLRLHRPPESLAQSFDFEEPAVSLDPVIFTIRRLLHTLAGRLASRHLAASRLNLQLVLESGAEITRQVRLPEPQTTVDGMLAPLQPFLESLRLDAAVAMLRLDAETSFATAAQRVWFGRQLPQPERWAETLAKLDILLGPGRVGIPASYGSFRPDDFTLLPATENPPTTIENGADRPACPLPLHRFRPPREIAVAYETRSRQPWPLALLNGPHPGEIIDRRGPFPASGNWWDPAEAWQGLEWDVQLASRHLVRLAFKVPDRWQLEGIYP